jgi:hypothetical protein
MEEKVDYQTSEISELVKALCKAKKDFKNITRDGKNPFLNSKYVTLDAIINATEDALSDNGLVIMHHQELIDSNKFLVTELIHESGQIKSTETCMNEYITVQTNERGNAKVTPIQIFGSIITYLKRYHIGELLNVAIDEDNDGSAPTDKGKQTGTTQNNPTDTDNLDRISEIEINQILNDCKQAGLETEIQALNKVISILKKNIKSLSELTMPEYATVIKAIGSSKTSTDTNGHNDADKNRKRAFAIASKLLINDEQISEYALLVCGHESRKDMTEEQWNQYCDYLIEYEKKTITEEQIAEMKALPKPYTDATLPKFLEFVNSNLTVAKEKTKDAKGNKVVHTPVTKLEHLKIWEADYIIRVLKANPKE